MRGVLQIGPESILIVQSDGKESSANIFFVEVRSWCKGMQICWLNARYVKGVVVTVIKLFYIIILSAILQTSSALGLCRPCDIQLIEVGASKSNNRL